MGTARQKKVEPEKKSDPSILEIESFKLAQETGKQFIWICAGFCAVLVSSLPALAAHFPCPKWLLLLPAIPLILFLITIWFTLRFLLALLARTSYHGDMDLLEEMPRSDMKWAIRFFRSSLTSVILVFCALATSYAIWSKPISPTKHSFKYSTGKAKIVIENGSVSIEAKE